jgi:hypothetical protein
VDLYTLGCHHPNNYNMELVLESLPAAAAGLNRKPVLGRSSSSLCSVGWRILWRARPLCAGPSLPQRAQHWLPRTSYESLWASHRSCRPSFSTAVIYGSDLLPCLDHPPSIWFRERRVHLSAQRARGTFLVRGLSVLGHNCPPWVHHGLTPQSLPAAAAILNSKPILNG